VADIIGAACTEIVEQEFRAGKFALTDGILFVDAKNGREHVATLLDYSIERCTWSTAIFLIQQGCPIVPDLEEGVCGDERAQFSTLGWAIIHEEGFYPEPSRDVACALMRHRYADIDIMELVAKGFDQILKRS
jgi:hypothetical protein